MKNYNTHEIAKIINVHPNTIRFYEEIGFITKPDRKENNYRIFTDMHLIQCQLIRCLLKNEIIQKGIRKKTIKIIELSAQNKYDEALKNLVEYQSMINYERDCAIKAINTVKKIINNEEIITDTAEYTRLEVAKKLNTTVDTIRNWELNGLIKIKRKKNGYRIYNDYDMKLLNIIRILRNCDYSLSSILRLLNNMNNKNVDVLTILNTSEEEDMIITACDHLIESLDNASNESENAKKIIIKLSSITPTFLKNV